MYTDSGRQKTDGSTAAMDRPGQLELCTKVGVVTGAARGIGQATGLALARAGIKALAMVDLSDDLIASTADGNTQLEREALFPFRGDVTDSAFRRHVFDEMRRRYGPVSICIPAAAITRDRLAVRRNKENGAIEIYPEPDFRRVMEVDLMAPIYWAVETIAGVAEDRAGRNAKRWEPSEPLEGAIIFIGSVSSMGNRGQISYATAKAGLEGAQATLAAEAIFHGMRCAIIHPGYTDTAMVRTLGDEFIQKYIIPQTQLRRLIYPEEIADAIVFMITNAAVSGMLWADAGWHPVV
jgi:NAD(P)-dependent dehydrogenase (short-subunit alcohol dehydrogenase family)